ncbi:MAG: hypothetical protein JXB46_08870 [Candidatus Eisenbacteria bacterium]|nr:hypothetical protein [Candidatus Eisenbacteria bacterium]
MLFCTAINCMDGRVQLPVIRYLQERFDVSYVDVVSEAGPVRALSDPADSAEKASILSRAGISASAHGSRLIAVVAHADCAGNPVGDEQQMRELAASVEHVAKRFPDSLIIGLWVGAEWSVSETCRVSP